MQRSKEVKNKISLGLKRWYMNNPDKALKRAQLCGPKISKAKSGKCGLWMKSDLCRITSPSNIDISWAAGIYEGEGCCSYKQSTEHVIVSQKDTWILDKLRVLFGGKVIRINYDSYSGRKPGYIHQWRCFGPRARGFLMTIYGFQSPRRKKQIKNVLIGKRTQDNKRLA